MKHVLIAGLLFCSSYLYGQERFVTIGRQNYRVKEFGSGNVTVIFENGMSDSLEVWGSIPDSVGKIARVFLYDRADIGKSDTSRNERTIPNMVCELKSILENEKIQPPFVLVGHSFGSLVMRYFASSYPDDVNGLLLLDPVPEIFWKKMSQEEFDEYVRGGTEWYETKFPPKYRKEWYYFISNLDYMCNLEIDKNLPIIVVSATAWNWYKYQVDILEEFENTQHILLEGEHHIFKDHPDKTIAYIMELINN